jgi:dUTP pyrophosphatase
MRRYKSGEINNNMAVFIDMVIEKGGTPPTTSDGNAGIDLHASEGGCIPACRSKRINTGLHMAIPTGYKGVVYGRSGLAFSEDIVPHLGVIDSSYRGEIKVLLYNMGDEDYCYKKGDRMAQLCIEPCPHVQLRVVDELTETSRGSNGFGSSGV